MAATKNVEITSLGRVGTRQLVEFATATVANRTYHLAITRSALDDGADYIAVGREPMRPGASPSVGSAQRHGSKGHRIATAGLARKVADAAWYVTTVLADRDVDFRGSAAASMDDVVAEIIHRYEASMDAVPDTAKEA